MKAINLSQVSFTALIWIVLFSANAYGWNCEQDCPSGIFSGKLECEAYQLGCTVEKEVKAPSRYYIYVKNGASVPIQVHVEWYADVVEDVPDEPGCVKIGAEGCKKSFWHKHSYWNLQPGEKALLVKNAVGRSASFSAESLDGTMKWAQKEVDMGEDYGRFTYTFSQRK